MSVDPHKSRREHMRWVLILVLNNARPVGCYEEVALATLQGVYPDATQLEVRRELDYLADRELVTIPTDPKERVFGLRTVSGDIRAQIAIFAHDEPTAKSLASQFLLFLDATQNRRFTATYEFAGQTMDWPVQLETPDAPAMSIPSESTNLTILAIDITLKATVPLFDAPAYGQPNDGQGTPETDDPAGYPKVFDVGTEALEAT